MANLIKGLMAVFKIGKNRYNGKSINVNQNGEVYIDGNLIHIDENKQVVTISVEGDVESIEGAFSEITVTGNTGPITSSSGDVKIGESVKGNVRASSGDIEIEGGVSGNVKTASGDVNVNGDVGGSASTTSGDINAKTVSGGIQM
jgi:hypothetical protein